MVVVVGVVDVLVVGAAGTGLDGTILQTPVSRGLLVPGDGEASELEWWYGELASAWGLFLLPTSGRDVCLVGQTWGAGTRGVKVAR